MTVQDLEPAGTCGQLKIGEPPSEHLAEARDAHGPGVGGVAGGSRGHGLGPRVEPCLTTAGGPVVGVAVVVVGLVEQVVHGDGVLALQGHHGVPDISDVTSVGGAGGVEHGAGAAISIGRVFLRSGHHKAQPDAMLLGLGAYQLEHGDVLIMVVQPGLVLDPGAPGITRAQSHQVAVIILGDREVLMPELLGGLMVGYVPLVAGVWPVEVGGLTGHSCLPLDIR